MEAALGSPDNEEGQKKLDRLARHKCRIERTFHRSLKELKALQTNAAIEATLPRYVRELVPPLSNANEIAKRTHLSDYLENRAREQAFIPENAKTSSA